MSSFWGSISTAYTALRATTSHFNLISENVNHSNTPGYKTKSAFFTESVQGIPEATNGVGGLANVNGISGTEFGFSRHLHLAGPIISTQRDTDFAFSQGGLFVTRTALDPNEGELLLTANGQFNRLGVESNEDVLAPDGLLDPRAAGTRRLNQFDTYLVDQLGNYLLGWPYDPQTGEFGEGRRTLEALAPINIRENVPYVQVSAVSTSAELDFNVPASTEVGTEVGFTFRIFDGTGTAIDTDERVFIRLAWLKTGIDTWEVSLQPDSINNRGRFESTDRWTVRFQADGESIQEITPSGPGQVATPQTSALIRTSIPGIGANGSAVFLNIDLRNVTQYVENFLGQSTSLGARGPSVVDGNPFRLVDFQSMDVRDDGTLEVTFTHGIRVPVAVIPLASVPNPNALEERDGPTFAATGDSGEVQLFDLTSSERSQIYNRALAQSTTNYPTEFTNLIQAQRSYGAASQVLRTIDEMVRTASQAKQ